MSVTNACRPAICACSLEEISPEASSGVAVQIVIFQRQMDPAEYRFVEFGDPVGREEQEPFKILQLAKEHCDKTVPVDILGGASFQKYIGFIQKKDRVPVTGETENMG